MTRAIRVLIADDSTVTRRLLEEAIAGEPDLELAGSVRNGEEALVAFRQHAPDVVLLDVEMPVISGVDAQRTISSLNPRVPVLMFSAATQRAAAGALEALAAGASDLVLRTAGTGHVDRALAQIRTDVIPQLRSWGRRYQLTQAVGDRVASSEMLNQSGAGHPGASVGDAARGEPVRLLVIGSGAGGPRALQELLSRLPGDLHIPVLIAQQLPPGFTAHLAARLDRGSRLNVREAGDGAMLQPGTVWLIPGDQTVHLEQTNLVPVLRLTQQSAAAENNDGGVDGLFQAAAAACGAAVVAVVLTGAGSDGLAGCRALRQRGATVLIQNPAEADVGEMPASIQAAGLADQQAALSDLPGLLQQLLTSG